jgi:hypothetical protein
MLVAINKPFDLDDTIIRWFDHRRVSSSGQTSWNTGSLGQLLGPCSLSVKKAYSSMVGASRMSALTPTTLAVADASWATLVSGQQHCLWLLGC